MSNQKTALRPSSSQEIHSDNGTTNPLAQGAVYRGEVVHKRLRPVDHRLNYRVFSLALDVDHLDHIASKLRLFSLDRFNLFSIKQAQHGYRDSRTIREFVWDQVRQCGMEDRVESVTMLFYPRIFGFAFNPLTVYFGLDAEGAPVLMIYEVRNTFGEDLTYVLPAGESHSGTYTHGIDKQFYVSPFNDVDGAYTFHVTAPDDTLTVGVALKTGGAPLLRTHFKGNRSRLSDWTLLKLFALYPLMTAKVVAGIHWEAAILWFKGLTLKTRPEAPKHPISYGGGLAVQSEKDA